MSDAPTPIRPPPRTPAPAPPPLPAAEARRRYLIFLAVRLAGFAVMVAGVWAGRAWGQAPGLAIVLLGGLTLLVRPRHLGLTNRGPRT